MSGFIKNKKKLSITAIALIAVQFIIMFIPFIFTREAWMYTPYELSEAKLSSRIMTDYFVGYSELAWISALLIISSISTFVLVMKLKNNTVKFLPLATIVTFIVMLLRTFIETGVYDHVIFKTEVYMAIGSYVIIGIHVLVIAVSVLLFLLLKNEKQAEAN